MSHLCDSISAISHTDQHYPESLKSIPNPPAQLYLRGDASLLQWEPKVAVIGTRTPSDYGQDLALCVSRDLAAAGCCVVSGLARGIDGLAHQAALEAGGKTIAVLGTGIDHLYPHENKKLAHAIIQRGLIISEYPEGSPVRNYQWADRNRIISGLVRGVIIIEAAEKSGTLITANAALDQGREVFAFPGPVDALLSEGTNALIRDGARLVRSADDVLTDLGLEWQKSLPFDNCVRDPYNGDEAEDDVMRYMSREPIHFDRLVELSGFSINEMSQRLMDHELAGRVRKLPGQRYMRRV